MKNLNNLLSLAAVARRLDLPRERVAALVKLGNVTPDAVAGRVALFEPDRIAALAAKIPGARILSPK